MKLFSSYLKQHRITITGYFIFGAVLVISFFLYQLPLAAVLYPMTLCFLIGSGLMAADFRHAAKKHRELAEISKLTSQLMNDLPPADSIEEKDYQKIIEMLRREEADIYTRLNSRYTDTIDYYTAWAHQIKTPIASMRLNLQNQDTDLSRRLSADLTRIEQYVEMVLMFLRLDSEDTDYVIEEYDMDSIVRQAVRRFSGEFISRKIGLDYQPINTRVITDEKWLLFVIEQVLSNALKYTRSGKISIYSPEKDILCIEDTGIGIAPEDLPRIFEKGYTGYNGRKDKHASGIGLYLARRICDNLGHKISARSVIGKGTAITIDLSREKIKNE